MRVNREMDAILKNPQISGKLADLGFFTTGADTPEAVRAYVRTQHDLWGRLTRDIGLQPE
jgi:tripartite-type tricarboxylate transporter receptor subunit TctC